MADDSKATPVALPFRDRTEAGRLLGEALEAHRGRDLLVLALPRGGVCMAAGVARVLESPLDLMIVRKLGVPSQPELAMGAIGSGGVRVLNADVIAALGIAPDMESTPSPSASSGSWSAASMSIAGSARRLVSAAAPCCWWMTGSRPVRSCAPPYTRRPRSSWQRCWQPYRLPQWRTELRCSARSTN
jgi:hypothetical protein